jgi:GABA permease
MTDIAAVGAEGAHLEKVGAEGAHLEKTLRSRHVTMIAIGGIIGAGLFVGSSTSIATAGPAVVVSFILAGLLVLLVMRMLSELAVLSPNAGSFTELIRFGLGDLAGMVSGWLYWYFWVVVLPVEAIAGAVILNQWLPLPVWAIGVLLLASMTLVNLAAAHVYGEFEFWLSTLKVGAIVLFIVIGGLWVTGLTSPSGPTWTTLTASGGFAPRGWAVALSGVTSVIFLLCGAEIATIAAAESGESAQVIARLTASVALRILLFYVLSIILIVCILPWTSIVPGKSPFVAALVHMGIPGAGVAMNAIVFVAVVSCLNSGMYVTSRVMFQLARRGDAPAALVKLSGSRVPARSTLIGSLFGYAALAASILSPQVVFSFLINSSGATMLEIYLLVCFAQLRVRRRLSPADLADLKIRMWLFPYATYAAIAGILIVLASMLFDAALRSQLFASLGVTALVGIAGLIRQRRRR